MHPLKISQARHVICSRDPYLGLILQRIEILPIDNIVTAATDGQSIFYSSEFVDSIELSDVVFILLHELLHIVLDHMGRRKDRQPLVYNIAADIVVNGILIRNGYIPSEKVGQIVTGTQYNIRDDQTVEVIYEQLPVHSKQLILNHHLWTTGSKFSSQRYDYKKSTLLRDVKVDGQKTTVNYRQLLSRYTEEGDYDYSYNRYHDYLKPFIVPSLRKDVDTLSKIWVLIDISGSMKENQIHQMMAELKSIIKQHQKIKIFVSYFSLDVSEPIALENFHDFENLPKKVSSRLGTSFIVIFEKVNLFFNQKPKAILIYTDGYGSFPSKKETNNIDTFWMINSHVQSPIGKTVHIGE